MDRNFRFFHSVDPRKVQCRIKSKFSKLTLSTKRNEQSCNTSEEVSKEDRRSRNAERNRRSLMTDDESDSDKEVVPVPPSPLLVNKLLLSESPHKELNQSDSDSTFCSLESMEKLEVTINDSVIESQSQNLPSTSGAYGPMIDELSQRVSCIGIRGNAQKPSPVVISSEELSGDAEQASQVVSRESQRKSCSANVFKENLEDKLADDSVSSAFTVSSGDSPIKISDPLHEQEEGEDDEAIITILSDATSDSGDYERIVSDSRPSGQTSLASTISNAKADHIMAFLKDVEKSQRQAQIACNDTQSMHESMFVELAAEEELADSPPEAVEVVPVSPKEPNPVAIADTQSFSETAIDSIPGTSLTVAETSVDINSPKEEPPQHESFETESDISEEINISAKINIKIHFSQQIIETVSSDSSESSDDDPDEEGDKSLSQNVQTNQGEGNVTLNQSKQSKNKSRNVETAASRSQGATNKSKNTSKNKTSGRNPKEGAANVSIEEFIQKSVLLTEIYGDAWKTPEVVETLQRTICEENASALPEESVLHDFSSFLRNVPNGLESTRIQNADVEDTFKCPSAKTTRSGRKIKYRIQLSPKSDTDHKENSKKNSLVQRKETTYGKLVYLDLTKEEVEVMKETANSPAVKNDKDFQERLDKLFDNFHLDDARGNEKTTPVASSSKSKRKLFTPLYGSDIQIDLPINSPRKPYISSSDEEQDDEPIRVDPINKQLESVKKGKPIFKIRTPQSSAKKFPKFICDEDIENLPPKTPRSVQKLKTTAKTPTSSSKKNLKVLTAISRTPKDKYGFLKSLDAQVSRAQCHPDALFYKDNYKHKKEELAEHLLKMYNEKLFGSKLSVPLVWNKKLTNTAGRCTNKRKGDIRSSIIDLSEKVLTSPDRLRCTLIHELCHAATWIFDEEHGHGTRWKAWSEKAMKVFPALPKIGICHQYDIEYKYTYKCTLCGIKSYAHSKSRKVDAIRCANCHGAIEIFLNKKDKEGNVVHTPVREAKGFAKFVKDKYQHFKKAHLSHADVMKLLSSAYAELTAAERLLY